MQVRVLGCSGAIAKDCRTTSFLVDGELLVDAGTGVGDLRLDEMAAINDVVLTHSPPRPCCRPALMIDAVASRRGGQPLRVHALRATIEALRAHIFNNIIWPDFANIPSTDSPFVTFHDIAIGQSLRLGDRLAKHIEVLPAVHTVPACGYAIRAASGEAALGFQRRHRAQHALLGPHQCAQIGILIIETAFSNREQALARRSRCTCRPRRWPTSWPTLPRAAATRSTSPTPSRPKPRRS